MPFSMHFRGAVLVSAAWGSCPGGGQELQLCSPGVGFSEAQLRSSQVLSFLLAVQDLGPGGLKV